MNKRLNFNVNFQKMFFISSCLVFIFICLLSIGYSAFNTAMEIRGDFVVRADVPFRFTNNSIKSLNNGGSEKASSKYSVDTISNHIDLPNCDSTATYNISLKNDNDYPVVIKNLKKDIWNNSNIDFDVIGYSFNKDFIDSNSEFSFDLRFKNINCSDNNTLLDSVLSLETSELFKVNYSNLISSYSDSFNSFYAIDSNDFVARFNNISDEMIIVTINGVELRNGESYTYSDGTSSLFSVNNGVATVTNVRSDITFDKKEIYYVTFNSFDKSLEDMSNIDGYFIKNGVLMKKVVNGEKYGKLPLYTSDHLKIRGWFDSSSFNNLISENTIVNLNSDIILYSDFSIDQVTTNNMNLSSEWIGEREVIVTLNGTSNSELYIRVSDNDVLIGTSSSQLFSSNYTSNTPFTAGNEVFITYTPISGTATLTKAFTIKYRSTASNCATLSAAELIEKHTKKNFDINSSITRTGILEADAVDYISVYSAAGNTFNNFKFKIKFGLNN